MAHHTAHDHLLSFAVSGDSFTFYYYWLLLVLRILKKIISDINQLPHGDWRPFSVVARSPSSSPVESLPLFFWRIRPLGCNRLLARLPPHLTGLASQLVCDFQQAMQAGCGVWKLRVSPLVYCADVLDRMSTYTSPTRTLIEPLDITV